MASAKMAPKKDAAKKGKYGGLGDARANQGGLYMLPGVYEVKVLKVTDMESRKGDDLFIVELEIVESDNDARRPGMKPSWVVNLKQDAALGNIKGFIAAAMGMDPSDESVSSDEWEDAVETAVSKENPLAGTMMHLECVNIKTREGGDFTLHRWSESQAAND